jgi:predicted enzyme related to lactoylglutathione lyase
MAPTLANGKLCYVEIPAIDVSRSALFYREVFGWASDVAATEARPSTMLSARSGSTVPGAVQL